MEAAEKHFPVVRTAHRQHEVGTGVRVGGTPHFQPDTHQDAQQDKGPGAKLEFSVLWQLHPTMINVSRCPQTSSVGNLATTLLGEEKCSVLRGAVSIDNWERARMTSRGNEEDTGLGHIGVTAFSPTTSADNLSTQHQKQLLGLIQAQGHPSLVNSTGTQGCYASKECSLISSNL